MRPVVTDRAASSVGRSVTAVSPAKTAELIEMPSGLSNRVGPRNHVLGGSAHWHHLANTIEPSVCGDNAACCQITLNTCFSTMQLIHIHSCMTILTHAMSIQVINPIEKNKSRVLQTQKLAKLRLSEKYQTDSIREVQSILTVSSFKVHNIQLDIYHKT